MKKLLSLTLLATLCTTLIANAQIQTTQKSILKNNYIDVKINQPVVTKPDPSKTLQETEAAKKVNDTKKNIEDTKKNFADVKKTWGIK